MCSVPHHSDAAKEVRGQALSSIVLLSPEFHTTQLHMTVPCMFSHQVCESSIGT